MCGGVFRLIVDPDVIFGSFLLENVDPELTLGSFLFEKFNNHGPGITLKFSTIKNFSEKSRTVAASQLRPILNLTINGSH
jgi:hypothetical protein